MGTSEKEANFRLHHEVDKDSIGNNLYCTICGVSITMRQKVKEHPVLKVAVCSSCLLEYEAVNFNGNDLCIWCGKESDTLRKCCLCKGGFCKKCLYHNLGDKGKWKNKWICLKCDTEPIWPLRVDSKFRKRSSSQEKINSNQQPLIRFKRSKSIGCALPSKADPLEDQIFKETTKNTKRPNYQTLHQFLRKVARDLDYLFDESKSSIKDFRLVTSQPYTTQISQIKGWFIYLCLFIDSVCDNLNHIKSDILNEAAECKNYDGISLLSNYIKRVKEKDEKKDTSPDSMVLPFSSSSESSQDDPNPLSSTSLAKSNPPKKFKLGLKKRKLIFSSDESSDETQQKKENLNHQSSGAHKNMNENELSLEAKDEAAILKELEDSNKKREENKQGSNHSESTEIYDFFTAQDLNSQADYTGETTIQPNYDALEVCPETGNYIGGTVPDSSQMSNLEHTDSDTQSFVFNIPDNLSKKNESSEVQAMVENVETAKDADKFESNRNEDDLLNIEERGPSLSYNRPNPNNLLIGTNANENSKLSEEGKQQQEVTSQYNQNENVNSTSVENDINQTLNKNKADVSEENSDLSLDVRFLEEKIDIEEEKPRLMDIITTEGLLQTNVPEEVKDENDIVEQINKILNTALEDITNINPDNVTIKEEHDSSGEYEDNTDEFEDLLSESDENEKKDPSVSDEERLKKALEHLQSDDFMIDGNSISASSLEVLNDDSFSDSEELNVASQSNEPEKENVFGQIVSLPLSKLDAQNNNTDNDTKITTINNTLEDKSMDNAPDSLSIVYSSNEQDEKGKLSDKPFVPKSCCVVLDRLPRDFVSNKLKEMKEGRDLEDAQLKRLFNLKNLDRKRRRASSGEEKEKKKQRNYVHKQKVTQQKETSSSSEYDQFNEDSDEEEQSRHGASDNIKEIKKNDGIEEHPYITLEEILRRQKESNFVSSDSEDDTDSYDDENNEENEMKNTNKTKSKKNKESEPKKDKKKKKKKTASWRNDSLLRGRFDMLSDSENSSDKEETKTTNKVSKRKPKLSDEDDSDIENLLVKRKRQKSSTSGLTDDDNSDIKTEASDNELRCIIPTKSFNTNKTIVLLSSSDSDIEFVTSVPARNKAKLRKRCNKSESEKETDSLKKKGRKNIRAIISDDVLEEDTKKAIEEEKQRNIRVSQKQQLMSTFLSQSSEILEEEGLILDVDNKTNEPLIVVNNNLSKRLKDHQAEGVKFMWSSCYESVEQIKQGNKGSGCILAHCMGLGKTFQVITLIHTLFKYHEDTLTKRVLVVCPLSTVLNWENEFKIAFNIATNSKKPVVHILGDEKNSMISKASTIKRWYDQGGVLVMGYEAYSSALKTMRYSQSTQDKVNEALVDPGPDLVILDEGHLLKNGKTSRTTTLMQIKTKRRIILTGTPMQNNLKEYYYMVNFVKPNLLGSWLEYSNQFVNPIVNGQYDDSTEQDVRKMKYRSHVLNKNLKRTIQRFEVSELETYLPPKLDYVLFVQLHPVQVQLYKSFLENLNVDVIQAGRIFAHYRYLQNVWTHPYLLVLQDKMKNTAKDKNIKEVDVIDLDPEVTVVEQKSVSSNWWSQIIPEDVETNIEYGPKFCIMLSIIEEATCCGDKIVVFSNSLNELDTIEHFLKLVGTPSCKKWRNKIEYYRMDGTVKPDSRMSLCMSFNNPKNTQTKVFLVSHKVGGLGLNLVAANRVILMDVNWNPSYDSQSVFRTYRFGQKKTCHVYRLVSMGTMEEVVYERSITKLAIAGRVVDERQISRHYRSDDLQKMYRANFDLNQPRPNLNVPEDVVLGKVYQKHIKELFKYHSHQSMLENLPHECLTEEEMEKAWLEFGKENEEAARKQEMNKQVMENAKKLRYQRNIQNINALAELATNNNNAILNNFTIARNENFVNIPNTSMSASLLPAAYHAFAKENAKNLKTFISSEMARAQTTASTSTKAPTHLGHFEEVYVPGGDSHFDVNDNRDNDVIVVEENRLDNAISVSLNNNKSENSNTNGQFMVPKSLSNNNRILPTNRVSGNFSKKSTAMRVQSSTSNEIPTEVIDVENHSILAMLAKNHNISVSQILKPKNPEVDDHNAKEKTSNNCDNVVETSVVIL